MYEFLNNVRIPTDANPNITYSWNGLDTKLNEISRRENFTYPVWPGSLGIVLTQLAHLTSFTKKLHLFMYLDSAEDFYSYASHVTYAGVVICEAPSTRFTEQRLNDPKYLPGVESLLRTDSRHCIKVFTVKNSEMLLVYTNKHIDINNIYQLLLLQQTMYKEAHPDEPEWAFKFATALASYNEAALRGTIIELLESDEIKKIQFEKFKKTLSYNKDKQVNSLKRQIENTRQSIAHYESKILELVSDIREWNDQLAFYRNKDTEDNSEQLYKYLNKHPYINNYACRNDKLILNYIAPLLYFSEAPAERFINNECINENFRKIVKTIVDRRYELYTQSQIILNVERMQTSVTTLGTTNYLGHPHIDRFNCFGNHSQILAETAEKGDFLGYIEELSQVVLNLNFYDGCVVETMCETLMAYSEVKTWKDTETGELLSTKEILERSENEET